MVFWNANGVSQHILEVKTFLKINQVDIMLISETHFTNKSYLYIPNYKLYYVNHPDGRAHGGSAILIRDNIRHHQGQHYSSNEIQATNVIIEDLRGPVTVSSIYSPPRHNIKTQFYLEFFKSLGGRFLACGDYNAKHKAWGSRLSTPKGRQLHCAILKLNLNISTPRAPTYWPTDINKIPDLIDFCVSKGIPPDLQKCFTSLDLSSDHTPVFLTIDFTTKQTIRPCKLHSKKTNWDYYRSLIKENINTNIPLKTEDDIMIAVEHLVETIQQAAWSSTPPDKPNSFSKCSAFIRNKVREKNKAKKRWELTKYAPDKTILNRLTSELKSLLNEEENKDFEVHMQSLDATKDTDYSLWKVAGKSGKTPKSNHPIRKSDNSWTKSNLEKANRFAEYLKTVFTPNDTQDPVHPYIESYLNETYQLELPIKKFTKQEIREEIRKLKLDKAPGYDLITAKTLKELPEEGISLTTYIFNSCITHSFVPPQWKVAQITMLQKPGKPPEHVNSYRPISVLPMMSKVLEKLFIKRLFPILEQKDLIPKHQFGFRKQHGTVEQIHRLVETIQSTFESKKYCTGAFLDISQAFDKVWHTGLLYKLKKSLPLNYFLFIKSYLQDRLFYVKEEDDLTDLHEIQAGVPQGSVLGPTLYLLYTNDLPQTENVLIGTFADDTALLAVDNNPQKASELLQKSISNISSWLQHWRIKANEQKSAQITFTLNRETCPPIKLNNTDIPQRKEVKYLGIYLDRRLTWNKHIKTKRKALDIQLSKLNYLLNSRSRLSLSNKLLVYKCILKPIWTYGIQLWGTASSSNLEILQRFQSKILRKITGAPWFVTNAQIHKDLQIHTIQQEIRKQLVSYQNRIQSHPNPFANNLMTNMNTFVRLRRKAPQDLLN